MKRRRGCPAGPVTSHPVAFPSWTGATLHWSYVFGSGVSKSMSGLCGGTPSACLIVGGSAPRTADVAGHVNVGNRRDAESARAGEKRLIHMPVNSLEVRFDP